ncbi:MAG: hypothetical protein FWH26_11040 [Oscillospiraceae bacterium]|nr:hypothetical protein [Oscillospiraceae bacterium]
MNFWEFALRILELPPHRMYLALALLCIAAFAFFRVGKSALEWVFVFASSVSIELPGIKTKLQMQKRPAEFASSTGRIYG